MLFFLNHFMPLASFYISLKQKLFSLLIFSGGIEKDQLHKMGERLNQYEQTVSSFGKVAP